MSKIVVDQVDYPFRRPVIDVEYTSRKLFEQYGPEAADIVRARIKQVRDGGDTAMVAIMKSILKAVEDLP